MSRSQVDEAQRIADEAEGGSRQLSGWQYALMAAIAAGWSLYQLAAGLIIMDSTILRAVHLAFALALVYMTHPTFKRQRGQEWLRSFSQRDSVPWHDFVRAGLAAALALYIVFDYEGISGRQGNPLPRDIVAGIALLGLLLEAARRALGLTLPIVACVFIAYCFLGPWMPDALAFKGVSLQRFIGQATLSTEGIYGVPLDVSANMVFLFVLFGALLDQAGAGQYFVDLAFSMLGRYRGGPAKAAVLASGMTGMVSGSSIANTVTTGTFTIPLMKKCGYPAHKAGAIEVACSTNGQLMPPIMGAAAFIIAEYCNLEYLAVMKAAFIPAVISYLALFYITHLEACKLGLSGLPKSQLPHFFRTLRSGLQHLLPIALLLYELVILRHSPQTAVIHAIFCVSIILLLSHVLQACKAGEKAFSGLKTGCTKMGHALINGGKNMMGIGVAVAAAGIIVGAVNLGLGGIITDAIQQLSGGNFIAILVITAIASLLLGMGLPTTANYIVMATLTAPVIVTLGAEAGIVMPLIAAHLFVFFFGILADDTPPVGLAAYAASAIAKSDPIKTGIQGFMYDIRTAILPFMFIFNTELLLEGVSNPLYAVWIFVTALCGMLAFAALTQNFFARRNRIYDALVLAGIALTLLRPRLVAGWMHLPQPWIAALLAILVFAALYTLQKRRPA